MSSAAALEAPTYDERNLSDLQRHGADWLRATGHRLLADPPGFGKTRTLLAATGDAPVLVVCPAAIRDARVWEGEATRTGWGGELHVISYHQLARWGNAKGVGKQVFELGVEAVIFDESHYLKNRNVSWAVPAQALGRLLEPVYLASGTPTPNVATELWGQLKVLRGNDMPAYWKWASGNIGDCRGWFHVTTEFDRAGRVLTEHAINGHLEECVLAGCHNGEPDLRPDPQTGRVVPGRLMPVTDQECEHWQRFRAEELEGWLLARPEELLDLPPMYGEDTPLWTPMTTGQRKAYNGLARDFLAEWVNPDTGEIIDLESISQSQRFVHLWQMSTGVGAVDPAADDRDSGKLKLVAEMLEDRSSPTLLACYFRNTGQILQNVCKRLGKRYATFGAANSANERRQAVERFQNGDLDVLVGSIAVVGEGLTLTAGDGVWLTERMWTPDKNTQVIRRVRRRGQDKPVGVRQFVTPDSIDAGQWEALALKRDRIGHVDPTQLSNLDMASLIRGKAVLR